MQETSQKKKIPIKYTLCIACQDGAVVRNGIEIDSASNMHDKIEDVAFLVSASPYSFTSLADATAE